jgi:uncharacterized protein
MKRLVALVSIATLTLVSGIFGLAQPARGQSAPAEQLWERGVQYYEQRDYGDAFPLLMSAARMGHARAQGLVAIMYHQGIGMAENDQAAAHWFALAAAQGHRASEYELGAMYEEGEGGLPKDARKAAELYAASARQGFDQAQFALGLSYEFGEGVSRNRQTALYWLAQAARQGDGQAHWIYDWLSRPSTPNFQNEEQLGNYIGSQVMQHYSGASPRAGGCPGHSGFLSMQGRLLWYSQHPGCP